MIFLQKGNREKIELVARPILLRNVEGDHGNGVLAEQGPAPDVRELQHRDLQLHVGDPGPLVGFQTLNQKSGWELWDRVFS